LYQKYPADFEEMLNGGISATTGGVDLSSIILSVIERRMKLTTQLHLVLKLQIQVPTIHLYGLGIMQRGK
jgi:hypothetical protein